MTGEAQQEQREEKELKDLTLKVIAAKKLLHSEVVGLARECVGAFLDIELDDGSGENTGENYTFYEFTPP